jgi:uncharacterized protein (TIGR02246 family)
MEEVIKKVILAYQEALNASDLEGVLSCYHEDAIVTPPGQLGMQSKGKGTIRTFYKKMFASTKLVVKFTFEDVEVVGDYAFIGSHSNNTVIVDGKSIPVDNRELFILKKSQDKWEIYRYTFN